MLDVLTAQALEVMLWLAVWPLIGGLVVAVVAILIAEFRRF